MKDFRKSLDKSLTQLNVGWFKPTNGSIFFPNQLLLDHQTAWCEEIFGIPHMKPNTHWTNEYYGGYNLEATQVLFTNGLDDPWHLISINQDLPSGVKAVTYQAGISHNAPKFVTIIDIIFRPLCTYDC